MLAEFVFEEPIGNFYLLVSWNNQDPLSPYPELSIEDRFNQGNIVSMKGADAVRISNLTVSLRKLFPASDMSFPYIKSLSEKINNAVKSQANLYQWNRFVMNSNFSLSA